MSVYKEGFSNLHYLQELSARMTGFDDNTVRLYFKLNDPIFNAIRDLSHSYSVTEPIVDRLQKSKSIIIKLVDEWAVCDNVKTIDKATEYYEIVVYPHRIEHLVIIEQLTTEAYRNKIILYNTHKITNN